MTVDTYEWFAPSSRLPPCDIASAQRAARQELSRLSLRAAVLSRDLCGDHAWRILLTIFCCHDPTYEVVTLSTELGMSHAELTRWLLALQSEQLLVFVPQSDRVFLTIVGQRKLVTHLLDRTYKRFSRREMNERIQSTKQSLVAAMHDGLMGGASSIFLLIVTVQPMISTGLLPIWWLEKWAHFG